MCYMAVFGLMGCAANLVLFDCAAGRSGQVLRRVLEIMQMLVSELQTVRRYRLVLYVVYL